MAFNFNWSPLATDASFYERAKELLTNALNRAGPRPAIIVDDFLVSEFNLGDVPPELEIVEIGDLAEDKFRGTFKMRYQGDAVLSLKTKVQANPLNTFLVTRASFATPQPLAAATGLTIPLQITLSDFRLSGFIILVFSRQKGLTIVFKDDPLESLKVSSTFDSIPFVANYLQKEIETQLRNLLMDELPAIIHRLSLRFWSSEHKTNQERDLRTPANENEETAVDPLANPPQDPVDSSGNVLSPAEVASLSLDSSVETQSLFSQKNLIRLATLTDSHRTLSLFTPSIRDAVFRAWTGPLERGEMPAFQSRAATPALSRAHSYTGSLSMASTLETTSMSRPSLYSFPSTGQSVTLGRHGKQKKRKHRIVNLRKKPDAAQPETITEDGSTITDSASVTDSTSEAPSVFSAPGGTRSSGIYPDVHTPSADTSPREYREAGRLGHAYDGASDGVEMAGPSHSRSRDMPDPFGPESPSMPDNYATLRAKPRQRVTHELDVDATPRASMYLPPRDQANNQEPASSSSTLPSRNQDNPAGSPTPAALPNFLSCINDSSNSSSIAERAWMMRMANEMTRKYEAEREKGSFRRPSQGDEDRSPPPAYAR